MSLTVNLYDGGTKPLMNPLTTPALPGMDTLRWIEERYEHWPPSLYGELEAWRERTNETLRRGVADKLTIRPWPEPISYHMPVDITSRYEEDDGGLRFTLRHEEPITRANVDGMPEPRPDMPPIAGSDACLHGTPPSGIDLSGPRRDVRVVRRLSPAETQTRRGVDPPDYLRRDFENELCLTNLGNPAMLSVAAVNGAGLRLCVPDNPLFVPFDFGHPERYTLRSASGALLEGHHALDLYRDGHYNVYLRPRSWYNFVRVLAHYLWISWFELVPNDETFLFVSYDRPPVFPYRHDVLQSIQVQDSPDWWGIYHSYDAGLEYQWTHSRAQAELSRQMDEQQFWSPCLAYLFQGNEDPVLSVELWPPYQEEIVCTIGRYDPCTGLESLVHVHASEDQAEWYPRTVLGTFLVSWQATVAPIEVLTGR